MYQCFRLLLGNEVTEPIDGPNLSQFQLVYTHPTKKDVKDAIVESFCQADMRLNTVKQG